MPLGSTLLGKLRIRCSRQPEKHCLERVSLRVQHPQRQTRRSSSSAEFCGPLGRHIDDNRSPSPHSNRGRALYRDSPSKPLENARASHQTYSNTDRNRHH